MKTYHTLETVLEFISSLLWPLITIIIFLILRKPIKDLIKKINKIGLGDTSLEINPQPNQKEEKSILELLGDGKDDSYIDVALGKFSKKTLEQSEEIIENETKISEVDGLKNNYERIYKYSKLLVIVKFFEKNYDLIYGSQIRFLQDLNHRIVANKSELKFYYDNAKEYYPEAYKTYNYENYISFLINQGLITSADDGENVKITNLGKDFLRYLIEANLSMGKSY